MSRLILTSTIMKFRQIYSVYLAYHIAWSSSTGPSDLKLVHCGSPKACGDFRGPAEWIDDDRLIFLRIAATFDGDRTFPIGMWHSQLHLPELPLSIALNASANHSFGDVGFDQ